MTLSNILSESLVLGWSDDKKSSILTDIKQFSQNLGFDIDMIDIEKVSLSLVLGTLWFYSIAIYICSNC